jgi:hypothetical protein
MTKPKKTRMNSTMNWISSAARIDTARDMTESEGIWLRKMKALMYLPSTIGTRLLPALP